MNNPQMFPLNWIVLFFYLLISFYFLVSLVSNFYVKNNQVNTTKNKKTKVMKMVWKTCW